MIIGATKRGLSSSDFKEMTIGMVFDYIITYNNQYFNEESDNDNEVRLATQADFNAF